MRMPCRTAALSPLAGGSNEMLGCGVEQQHGSGVDLKELSHPVKQFD